MGAEQLITAHFHLRPHLHDLLTSLCGERPRFDPRDSVGLLVRTCLVRRQPPALEPGFLERRKRFTFQVSLDQRERYGCWAGFNEQRRFEHLVQHLFDEKLLSHVTAAQHHGMELRAAVRHFMDSHDISAEHCDYDNLRRTVERMRATRRTFGTSVPPAAHAAR